MGEVVGKGTRRRGRRKNLVVATQGSVGNLLCGRPYPYLLAIEAHIS